MVLDVSFIVFPQALPGGCVQDECKGLEGDGNADIQVSVDHVVIQCTGSLLPTERAPEQTRGVNPGPEDQRRWDKTCQNKRHKSCFYNPCDKERGRDSKEQKEGTLSRLIVPAAACDFNF